MLTQLAIADSDPRGSGNEIVVAAFVGLLLGTAFVLIGSQKVAGQPPRPNVNCPTQPCGNGTICDAKLGHCVVQSDGGGGKDCAFCGAGVCCPPWRCNHVILDGICVGPSGETGSGNSQCPTPCAASGLVCNPYSHQCEDQGSAAGWTVDWGNQLSEAVVFLENVTPIVLEVDPSTGGYFPAMIDAAIAFTYTGPGGSATAGFSLRGEQPFFGQNCEYSFSSQSNVYLDVARIPTDVTVSTTGLLWPDNCILCPGNSFTVWPYVVLPDGPHYGPPFPSLLSC